MTLSLEATRASRFLKQGYGKARTTKDTCGHLSDNTFKQSDLFDVSLKTLKTTSRSDSPESSAIWRKMVINQRREYSQRAKLARLIKESECTSWLTPTASDWKNMDTSNQQMLSKQVKMWPTPTAHLGKEGGYPAEYTRKTPSLTSAAMKSEMKPHSSGYLNPDWVEWLMGVPTGWTGLDSWETE